METGGSAALTQGRRGRMKSGGRQSAFRRLQGSSACASRQCRHNGDFTLRLDGSSPASVQYIIEMIRDGKSNSDEQGETLTKDGKP